MGSLPLFPASLRPSLPSLRPSISPSLPPSVLLVPPSLLPSLYRSTLHLCTVAFPSPLPVSLPSPSTFFLVSPIKQVKQFWNTGNLTATIVKIVCVVVFVLMIALSFCAVFWVSASPVLK